VILDLGMPLMNGLEAAAAIKRAVADRRVILFTAPAKSAPCDARSCVD